MKSRTLISFCQRPVRNPCQDVSVCSRSFIEGAVAAIATPSHPGSHAVSGREPQQRTGMPGNDQFFVRWDHPCRNATAVSGDSRLPCAVRFFVQLYAEPGRGRADSLSNLGGVLADARGEDETVDSAQDRRERADFLGCAIDEIIQG